MANFDQTATDQQLQQLAAIQAANQGYAPQNVILPYTGSNLTPEQSTANVAAAQNQLSTNTPLSVPNRNLTAIPSSSDLPSDTSTVNLFSNTSTSSVLSTSTSSFQSNQLPAFSGSTPIYSQSQLNTAYDLNDPASQPIGYTAASDTSYDASQNYSDLQDDQDSSSDDTDDDNDDGSAEPVDSGLLQGAGNLFNNAFSTLSSNLSTGVNAFNLNNDPYDRVKLRFAAKHPLVGYPGVLWPLSKTGGLVWLYKPSVSISSNVEYDTMNLAQAIQEMHSFVSNRAPTITVTGPVISQNIDEAMYALASIHFLQSASKMSFGNIGMANQLPWQTNSLPWQTTATTTSNIPIGSPPPVLLFSGYGPCMFNDLPVIITSISLDLPPDVDYIEVPSGAGAGTKIPVVFSLSVNLTVQRSSNNMRSFNLSQFSTSGQKGWW